MGNVLLEPKSVERSGCDIEAELVLWRGNSYGRAADERLLIE
jgi:hypothetical protein